jgi:hypothetical protein
MLKFNNEIGNAGKIRSGFPGFFMKTRCYHCIPFFLPRNQAAIETKTNAAPSTQTMAAPVGKSKRYAAYKPITLETVAVASR